MLLNFPVAPYYQTLVSSPFAASRRPLSHCRQSPLPPAGRPPSSSAPPQMVEFSISNARYTYLHDQKYPSEDVDIHHIVLRRSGAKYFFVYASALIVLACAMYLYVLEEKPISLVYYSLLFDIFLVKLLLRKPVKKESVVIMPAFGVQLETHYLSGKVVRCFVPIHKILKPVLLECVTPVTCYWTLSLIVRGESEVVLVFKNLRPPVKMLVHVWKALCAATDSKEETCDYTQ